MTQTLQVPPALPASNWAFDDRDPQVRRMIETLQSRGADDNTVRLCLGMNLLDQIIADNRSRKRHLFCAGFPKSGTTYLHKLLLSATGFVDYLIDRYSEDQQQNIIRQWMPMFLCQDTVTQIHMFATAPNTRMLKELGVKPIVVVRDVCDALVSLRDHLVREDFVVPLAQVPREFRDWAEADQYWFMVRMITPWYLNFFASWRRASAEVDVLWIQYEELVSQTPLVLPRVLKHADVESNQESIDQAIAAVDLKAVRFNVGVSGRGRKLLSQAQQDTIAEIARCFHDGCDFSMIGL